MYYVEVVLLIGMGRLSRIQFRRFEHDLIR